MVVNDECRMYYLPERIDVCFSSGFAGEHGGGAHELALPADSLRLGYMVIPCDLLHHFEATLSLTSRHAPLLDQLVVSEFISEGHFGRHVRRMCGACARSMPSDFRSF
jgi:hypothetical protein